MLYARPETVYCPGLITRHPHGGRPFMEIAAGQSMDLTEGFGNYKLHPDQRSRLKEADCKLHESLLEAQYKAKVDSARRYGEPPPKRSDVTLNPLGNPSHQGRDVEKFIEFARPAVEPWTDAYAQVYWEAIPELEAYLDVLKAIHRAAGPRGCGYHLEELAAHLETKWEKRAWDERPKRLASGKGSDAGAEATKASPDEVAARLKALMRERNFSVGKLSQKTQLGKSTIKRILRGKARPKQTTQKALAESLRVDERELFGRASDPT